MCDILKMAARRAKRANDWASQVSTFCIQGIFDLNIGGHSEVIPCFSKFLIWTSTRASRRAKESKPRASWKGMSKMAFCRAKLSKVWTLGILSV